MCCDFSACDLVEDFLLALHVHVERHDVVLLLVHRSFASLAVCVEIGDLLTQFDQISEIALIHLAQNRFATLLLLF